MQKLWIFRRPKKRNNYLTSNRKKLKPLQWFIVIILILFIALLFFPKDKTKVGEIEFLRKNTFKGNVPQVNEQTKQTKKTVNKNIAKPDANKNKEAPILELDLLTPVK